MQKKSDVIKKGTEKELSLLEKSKLPMDNSVDRFQSMRWVNVLRKFLQGVEKLAERDCSSAPLIVLEFFREHLFVFFKNNSGYLEAKIHLDGSDPKFTERTIVDKLSLKNLLDNENITGFIKGLKQAGISKSNPMFNRFNPGDWFYFTHSTSGDPYKLGYDFLEILKKFSSAISKQNKIDERRLYFKPNWVNFKTSTPRMVIMHRYKDRYASYPLFSLNSSDISVLKKILSQNPERPLLWTYEDFDLITIQAGEIFYSFGTKDFMEPNEWVAKKHKLETRGAFFERSEIIRLLERDISGLVSFMTNDESMVLKFHPHSGESQNCYIRPLELESCRVDRKLMFVEIKAFLFFLKLLSNESIRICLFNDGIKVFVNNEEDGVDLAGHFSDIYLKKIADRFLSHKTV